MFEMTIVDSTMIPGHIFIIPGHKDVGETGRRGTIRTPDFSQPSDKMETNVESSSRILMCYFYAHIFDSVFFVFFYFFCDFVFFNVSYLFSFYICIQSYLYF